MPAVREKGKGPMIGDEDRHHGGCDGRDDDGGHDGEDGHAEGLDNDDTRVVFLLQRRSSSASCTLYCR